MERENYMFDVISNLTAEGYKAFTEIDEAVAVTKSGVYLVKSRDRNAVCETPERPTAVLGIRRGSSVELLPLREEREDNEGAWLREGDLLYTLQPAGFFRKGVEVQENRFEVRVRAHRGVSQERVAALTTVLHDFLNSQDLECLNDPPPQEKDEEMALLLKGDYQIRFAEADKLYVARHRRYTWLNGHGKTVEAAVKMAQENLFSLRSNLKLGESLAG